MTKVGEPLIIQKMCENVNCKPREGKHGLFIPADTIRDKAQLKVIVVKTN